MGSFLTQFARKGELLSPRVFEKKPCNGPGLKKTREGGTKLQRKSSPCLLNQVKHQKLVMSELVTTFLGRGMTKDRGRSKPCKSVHPIHLINLINTWCFFPTQMVLRRYFLRRDPSKRSLPLQETSPWTKVGDLIWRMIARTAVVA